MMRHLIVAAVAICLAASAAPEKLHDREVCDQVVDLLSEEVQDLPVTSCSRPEHSQIRVSVRLNVPAARVVQIQNLFVERYDMQPLRFVCCGYETRPITILVPEDHPLKEGTPVGAYRDISATLSAPGMIGDGQNLQPLGAMDGTLMLELVDY